MADSEIIVTGIPDLIERINSITGERMERILFTAIREGAKVEQYVIQSNTPEAAIPPSPHSTALPVGALVSDIAMKPFRDEDGSPAYIVGPDKYTTGVARWLEYGHRLVRGGYSHKVYDKQGNHTGKYRGQGTQVDEVEPHPFLRRSWDEAREQVYETINASVHKQIAAIRK